MKVAEFDDSSCRRILGSVHTRMGGSHARMRGGVGEDWVFGTHHTRGDTHVWQAIRVWDRLYAYEW